MFQNLKWLGFKGNRKSQDDQMIYISFSSILQKGEYADVIARRNPAKFTNIAWIDGDNMDGRDGFEWGYYGCGPRDFAYNILLHFTDGDDSFAEKYCIDFAVQFLKPLPIEGGRICKEEIFTFIEAKRDLVK